MVETKQLQAILRAYGISAEMNAVVPLEEMENETELRLLYRIDLQGGLQLVCRISREARYPKKLIEQQSRFSEKLRAYDLPTAKKYRLCAADEDSYVFDVQGCYVTLEQYAGTDVEAVELQTFHQLGVLQGKIHFVSEHDPSQIDYAATCRAITEGRATFDRILTHSNPALSQRQDVKTVQTLHDALVSQLRGVLAELPHGAVHGDLGVFNNLVTADGRVFIVDFNLAGDEPFLCDLLTCFYSSIYKYAWRDRLQGIDDQQAFSQFLSGYTSQRGLTDSERRRFSLIAALFDGLFYCKAILEEYSDTGDAKVLERFHTAISKFDQSNHCCPFELGVY